MGKNSFYERCLSEYEWRHEELSLLFEIAKKVDCNEIGVALKSLIPMVYAHWEGFVYFCLNALVDELKKIKININECNQHYLFLAARKYIYQIKDCTDTEKIKKYTQMFSDLSIREYIFEAIEKDQIRTMITSNIGPKVLKKIGRLFCFSDDFFDTNTFSQLDELVTIRNHIAHGENSYIFDSLTDVKKYFSLFENLSLDFINEIDKILLEEKFRKGCDDEKKSI